MFEAFLNGSDSKSEVLQVMSGVAQRIFIMFSAVFLGLMIVSGASVAQDGGGSPVSPIAERSIDALRLIGTTDRARLIVDLSEPTQFAFVSIGEPMGIAVDVRVGSAASNDLVPESLPNGFVGQMTFEQVNAERSRIFLELKAPAQVSQAYVLEATEDQPARLVVDLVGDTEAAFFERVAADIAALPDNNEPELGDNSTPAGETNIELETRPLILIDPGHGGIDGGAVSADGHVEKEITLSFAMKLRDILIESGRFDVALSRESDVFLKLEERVQIARDNRASLFISVHADAFDDPSIKGAALYTRDEQATDILDKVLAESENEVDLLAGFAPPEANQAAVDILVDLMRREMRRQAFLAARAILDQMQPSIVTRRFALRRADFFVLQSPDVPSILLELGFLSNADDFRNLSDLEWQDRAARAVARGIAQYFDAGGGT